MFMPKADVSLLPRDDQSQKTFLQSCKVNMMQPEIASDAPAICPGPGHETCPPMCKNRASCGSLALSFLPIKED